MRKLSCVLLAILFCFMIAGTAYADTVKDLVEWDDSYCVSSDDPSGSNTIDYMDPGNPNSGDAADIGSMTCEVSTDNKTILCVIDNAYPGYQASINTRVMNITNYPVEISSIEVIDKPDCIVVSLTDADGNELIGSNAQIDKNSSMDVMLVTRVLQSASQDNSYQFLIKLTAQQTERGGHQTHGSGDTVGGGQTIIVPNFVPGEPQPAAPQKEPINIPIQLPELPYTGGDILMLVATGAVLGGLGFMFKRRK